MARPSSQRQLSSLALDGILLVIGLGLALAILSAAMTAHNPQPPSASVLKRLGNDPLDLPALRDLALGATRRGRSAEADALLSFVARRTWRDGPTEAWLFRERLGQGRFKEAFEHADSLLRRDAEGTLRPALFGVLSGAAAYVEARPALVARLRPAPVWRTDFLQDMAVQGDVAGVRSVLTSLAAGPNPPSAEEYAPFITRLVKAGDYRAALDAWTVVSRRTGPTRANAAAGTLGDLAATPDHTPFTWSAAEGVGATGDVRASPDGSGRPALRVDYDGFSTPRLPARMLVLETGRYRVAWRESGDGASAGRLNWRVRCADAGQVIARAEAPPAAGGSADWLSRAMAFEVPQTGCGGQWLELVATPGERRDPGTAWYEGLQLIALR